MKYDTGDSRTSQAWNGGLLVSKKIKTIRKDIRVPESLVKQIEEYQIEQGIPYWTTALLELARKGLEEVKKDS